MALPLLKLLAEPAHAWPYGHRLRVPSVTASRYAPKGAWRGTRPFPGQASLMGTLFGHVSRDLVGLQEPPLTCANSVLLLHLQVVSVEYCRTSQDLALCYGALVGGERAPRSHVHGLAHKDAIHGPALAATILTGPMDASDSQRHQGHAKGDASNSQRHEGHAKGDASNSQRHEGHAKGGGEGEREARARSGCARARARGSRRWEWGRSAP